MKFFLPLITLVAGLAAAAPAVNIESSSLESRQLKCPPCDDLSVCTCGLTLVSSRSFPQFLTSSKISMC